MRRRSDGARGQPRLSRIAPHLAHGVKRTCWALEGRRVRLNGLKNDAPQGGGGFWRELDPQRRIRGQMNNGDGPVQVSAHRRLAVARALAKRGLVAFLALTMAFGTTPAQLWADGAEGIAEAVAAATDGSAAGDSAAKDAANADDEGQTSGQKAADSDATGAAESASAAQVASDENAPAAAAQAASNGQAAAVQSDASVALSSNAKVYIQDAKDKNSSYSNKYGTLSAGDVLWANMYDGTSSYSSSSVANPGTWTYQWLAGMSKSSSIADYTELVGTEQSLTVTEAMAGKYLICKITADGKDYYGPATSYGSGINSNYIPGPVLKAGQVELYSVKLDKTSPAVGDAITATPYISYGTVAPEGTQVTYAWYYSTSNSYSATWTKIEGQSGASLAVTDDLEGKYLKVVANAGVNDEEAKTSDKVLKAGAVKLAGVELTASSNEVGATLAAKAYTGSSYSPSYVDNDKVTYTWKKYKGASSPSYSTVWETIEGQSGPTLSVTDDLAGCYISVSANAGANDVNLSYSSAVGPFKVPGQVDIYAASIQDAGSGASGYVYTADQTVKVIAKEKGSSAPIDSSKLNYQWQEAKKQSSLDSDYTDIEGATSDTLPLSAYKGKSVRCVISSKVGTSVYKTRGTVIIAAPGSINVSSVALSASGKAYVGDTVTATAKASGEDVSENKRVSWQWYWGDSSSASACTNKIEDATSRTFAVSDAYLGKYLVARANGGFGETASAVLGPIVEPGAVELYGVELTGAQSNGGVHVGETLTAKATKGNSYTFVTDKDTVHYQWQYAESKSTLDTAFKNIPGAADSSTYAPTSDMVGKYIRVIATSENSVKSTQKKSYYGTTSVDPVGPVALAGQYTLKSVAPAEASSATLSVGAVLTPSVRIPGSSDWSDSALPSDAKLTVAWFAKGDGDADWVKLTDGIDSQTGALTISDALAGKRLKLTASALDNEVEWVSSYAVTAAGEYDLLRVVSTPQLNSSNTNLVAGDSVSATVYAKRVDGSTTNGISVTDKGVDVSWYVADKADAAEDAWSKLDVTGASIQVPDAAANKYLKAVATSGSSKVELVSANKVIEAGSLAAAVQKLNAKNVQLSVDYTAEGANVNDLLKDQLKGLGFDDVDVKVSEGGVLFRAEDAGATVGISDAQDESNGNVTFFYMDPDAYTGYNLDQLRSADVVFELSRDGEETEYYQPSKAVKVAWNEDKLQDLLDSAAEQATIGYALGDSAESVTQNLTLPYKAGSNKKLSVEWESSDSDALFVSGYGYSDYTGKVARKSSDRNVTLTAKVTVPSNVSDGTNVAGEATHAVTVKGDPQKVAADKAELQTKIDAAFTYDNVKDFVTGEVADKDGLTGDLQMPRTSVLGIDGKYYKVAYSASTNDVTFNGYKGTVYQPLPGSDAASTQVTLTVTDKSNDEVSASKTLDYKIAPQDQGDLDAALWEMDLAETTFAQAVLDGQDQTSVTGNLHAPVKGYQAGLLGMNWCYSADEAQGHLGIVPVDLSGYDPMSGQQWRLFKSSRPSVISHENLLVTQPQYNTKVTISARLSSEKYARYAERYPDNEDYAALANRDVSATVTVKGTTGLDDPNAGKTKTVTAKVTGISQKDAEGNYTAESVVPLSEVTVPADEDASAEEILEGLLKKAGCTELETNDYGLTSVKLPDGRVLDSDFTAPYRYWSFYVNDGYASVGASQYYVQDGDCIEFRYSDGSGVEKPTDTPATNPDAEHPNLSVGWNGFAGGGSGALTDAPTPTTPTTKPSWATSLLSEADIAAGKSASASDPLIIGGKLYVVTGTNFYDANNGWQLTQGIAHLLCIDPATGSVVSDIQLGTSMDSTCRPVYSDGIIVIPLSGGYLQAVSASTLETLWFSDAFAQQSLSSLTVDNGYVYLATVDRFGEQAQANTVVSGTVKRLNLYTGAEAGSLSSDDGGYYWTGGVMVGDYYVIADDFGNIKTFSKDLSKLVSKKNVSSSPIRSALVVDNGFVYVVSRDDGTLHKLAVGSDGSIVEISRLQFAAYSTSTPTISNGYAYIGGAVSGKGMLAVVDLSGSMSLVKKVETADGSALVAESKSTPLVSTHDGETYVYFTCNGAQGPWPNCTSGGGIYMYKLGDAEAHEVFAPGAGYAQYCMASVIADADGNLYYTNDSGNLFCIKSTRKPANNGGNGSNTKSDENKGNGSGADFSMSGSGGGIQGLQVGGTVAATNKPVAQTSTGSKSKDSAKDSGQTGKKKSKKKGAGSAGSEDGSKESEGAALSARATGIDDAFGVSANPFAITGVIAGVIGLALIATFVFTRRDRGDGNGR